MNEKQFRLFCICFCKKCDGYTFGEVIEDIVTSLSKNIISIKNICFDTNNGVIFRVNGYVLFRFSEGKILYVQRAINNNKISARWTVVDVSDFVFEDIV